MICSSTAARWRSPRRRQPQSVTFAGLEAFRNSGTINLANGTAGDTLTLPGSYVGSGNAALALDLIDGKADTLVIGGAATGSTQIQLATGGNATLLSQPITLVDAGAGTSSGAFTLASASSGFIQYGLSYDGTGNTFDLTAQAGAPVYRLAKVSEGAEAVWTQSADAWSAHMAALRDQQSATDSRLWGQAYGKVTSRDDSRSVDVPGSSAQTYRLDYRQDYFGGQLGYDLGNLGGANGAAIRHHRRLCQLVHELPRLGLVGALRYRQCRCLCRVQGRSAVRQRARPV